MRFLSLIVVVPVLAAVVCFAFANRNDVGVSLWPFDATVVMPLSFLALGVLFAGMLAGSALTGMWAVVAVMRRNFRIRRLEKSLAERGGMGDDSSAGRLVIPAKSRK